MKFLSDSEAETQKQKLEYRLAADIDFDSLEFERGINWLDTKAQEKALKNESKSRSRGADYIFLAHSRDIIKGKPQLIHQTKQSVILMRKIQPPTKMKKDEDEDIKFLNSLPKVLFLDEPYDKRYSGQTLSIYTEDFWVYRVIDSDNLEYYILSRENIPQNHGIMKGMTLHLDDSSEFSKSMRLKSLTRIFILKEFEPSVKILSKKEIVDFTKGNKISEKGWFDLLALHPNGNLNRFPKETEQLKSSFILSGKCDGYPLHISIMGKAGTKKSSGLIETTGYKFSEEHPICEGGNTRIKALTPSFKEKPANIGFLAKAERVGLVDEMGKIVEQELNKHQQVSNNHLGELNFLMEHKKRLVGSGNDNECLVQATAKFMKVTNPMGKKLTIHAHISLLDPTYMSRSIWWVQDYEETAFALSPKSIERIPPTHTQDYESNNIKKKDYLENGLGGLTMCRGELRERDNFLTLFDTCYSFLSEIDDDEVQKLVDYSSEIAHEPMKTNVWIPRAFHHVKLLVDGACKRRCLFVDYDSSFKANSNDYEEVKNILTRMVRSWDTDFSLNKRPQPVESQLKISKGKYNEKKDILEVIKELSQNQKLIKKSDLSGFDDLEDSLSKLKEEGIIFEPKEGFIQLL